MSTKLNAAGAVDSIARASLAVACVVAAGILISQVFRASIESEEREFNVRAHVIGHAIDSHVDPALATCMVDKSSTPACLLIYGARAGRGY